MRRRELGARIDLWRSRRREARVQRKLARWDPRWRYLVVWHLAGRKLAGRKLAGDGRLAGQRWLFDGPLRA
jgi:hypothetical protein